MFPNPMQGLRDFQAFHLWLDEQKEFHNDLYFIVVLLAGELGEVAQVVKKIHRCAEDLKAGHGVEEAQELALGEYREAIGEEIADCLAYLLKLANAAGVDLQQEYLAKMERNMQRDWRNPQDTPEDS